MSNTDVVGINDVVVWFVGIWALRILDLAQRSAKEKGNFVKGSAIKAFCKLA